MKFLVFLVLFAGVAPAQCTYNYTLKSASATVPVDNSLATCTNFVLTYTSSNTTKLNIGLEASYTGGEPFTTFPGTAPSNLLNGTIISNGVIPYLRVNVYYLQGNGASVSITLTGSIVSSSSSGSNVSISIDPTTTILPYGTAPAVTNIGTSSSIILHFSLPQGPPGQAGSSTSGGDVSYTFYDNETPSGAINGTNLLYSLQAVPTGNSLILVKNGAIQQVGGDYTLNGNAITFISAAILQTGDTLKAWYRVSSSSSTSVRFVDGETPRGTQNGTNNTFSFSETPISGNSIILSRNGLVQNIGIDFSVNGSTLTWLTGSTPASTDTILAWYRY